MSDGNEITHAEAAPVTTTVLIIGAGFGGLCMAATLKRAGINDFLVLDKAEEVGGTWRVNTYPGAECDVASALYSYSFAPNPVTGTKWAGQEQILAYLKKFADDFELRPHLRLGQPVGRASFDEQRGRWRVVTQAGAEYDAAFVVSGVGQLSHPKRPDIPGQDLFQGAAFHSAEWQHDVELEGKSVAVIGNAASAVQLVPELARRAAALTVYQRSANWILPKHNRPYSAAETALASVFPGLAKLYRLQTFLKGEYLLYPAIKGSRVHQALVRWACKRHIRQSIKDPGLRAALLPDYPIGAKRVLLSDQYYPALTRSNVRLVTTGIREITSRGIMTDDNLEHNHDVIVYATGFRTNPFLKSLRITGKANQPLSEHWRQGAHAYLGTMTAGYPNFFMLYGPNTNPGHSSVVYFLEAQARMIRELVARAGDGTIEVTREAEEIYNQALQSRLQTMAWAAVEDSWYKDGEMITNNWPGTAREYSKRTGRPNWAHFLVRSNQADAGE